MEVAALEWPPSAEKWRGLTPDLPLGLPRASLLAPVSAPVLTEPFPARNSSQNLSDQK